jgi:hypothetical protein
MFLLSLFFKKAFWDVTFGEADFENSSLFVMEEVFNYGGWDDQVKIMSYYGMYRLRSEIVHARYLRRPVLGFLCVIFKLQKIDFECYDKMLLNPLPWPY